MNSRDLLDTARTLARAGQGRPGAAHLRRAVSSIYYALFHHLAGECANQIVGTNKASRSNAAWKQTYRALEHGFAASRCRDKGFMAKFLRGIQDFANAFTDMQDKRHEADYSPDTTYLKNSVIDDIEIADDAIKAFGSVSIKHRRAFCVYVLLRERKDTTNSKRK